MGQPQGIQMPSPSVEDTKPGGQFGRELLQLAETLVLELTLGSPPPLLEMSFCLTASDICNPWGLQEGVCVQFLN